MKNGLTDEEIVILAELMLKQAEKEASLILMVGLKFNSQFRITHKMDYAEFQEKFEEEADKTYQVYSRLSEDELLKIIEAGQYDEYYQIWQVLGMKGTRKSMWLLFNIVSNLNNPYLIRYHACDALFRIARINNDEFKGLVQYGRDRNGRAINQSQAILQLRKLIS